MSWKHQLSDAPFADLGVRYYRIRHLRERAHEATLILDFVSDSIMQVSGFGAMGYLVELPSLLAVVDSSQASVA